jgi:hypothetical protein
MNARRWRSAQGSADCRLGTLVIERSVVLAHRSRADCPSCLHRSARTAASIIMEVLHAHQVLAGRVARHSQRYANGKVSHSHCAVAWRCVCACSAKPLCARMLAGELHRARWHDAACRHVRSHICMGWSDAIWAAGPPRPGVHAGIPQPIARHSQWVAGCASFARLRYHRSMGFNGPSASNVMKVAKWPPRGRSLIRMQQKLR